MLTPPALFVAGLVVGVLPDPGCDCGAMTAVLHGGAMPAQPCVLRGVLSGRDAVAAADAAWRYLEAHPTPLRGGNGADVSHFDGGGVS